MKNTDKAMITFSHEKARKVVGLTALIALFFFLPKADSIISTIETHHWVAWLLLLCAAAYTVWGMFWE